MFPSKSLIALVPAAGSATRFGGRKQLAKLNGRTLLAHTIDNCRAGGCAQVYVISGHSQESITKEARQHEAIVFHNENWANGMGSSIDFGLENLMEIPGWNRILILPTDMPWFTGVWIKVMANKVAELVGEPKQAVATDYPQGPGAPVILSRAFIEHCYFASPNKKKLKKLMAEFIGLKTIPSGPHTRDVDYKSDLV